MFATSLALTAALAAPAAPATTPPPDRWIPECATTTVAHHWGDRQHIRVWHRHHGHLRAFTCTAYHTW